MLLFPVVGRCRSHLGHFLWTRHDRKHQNCCWNFDAIYDSSRDVSISGLAILLFPVFARCRNHLQMIANNTFFDVAVVGKLDLVTWITTTLILDLFCHRPISQHDIKYRQFQKKIHTCLTSCQTTSGALIGDLIVVFCTHFIFRKSHERQRPMLNRFFYWFKNWAGAFFYPKRNTRVNIGIGQEVHTFYFWIVGVGSGWAPSSLCKLCICSFLTLYKRKCNWEISIWRSNSWTSWKQMFTNPFVWPRMLPINQIGLQLFGFRDNTCLN